MRRTSLIVFLALATTCSLSAQILNHRYSFETDVSDSVGNAHGTLVNNAIVEGGQLVLAGGPNISEGAYASLPGNVIGINNYNALTVEMWFTPTAANTTFTMAAVFGRHYSGWPDAPTGGDPDGTEDGAADDWAGYQYLMMQPTRGDPAEGMRVAITRERFNTEAGVNLGAQLNDAMEHHVVATVDATNLSFYLDGTLVGTVEIGENTLANLSNEQAYLGASVYQFDDTFAGSIDDFRIWDGAFSASQVAASFELGSGSVIPEPSTYAMLFGALALAGVIVRRRLGKS